MIKGWILGILLNLFQLIIGFVLIVFLPGFILVKRLKLADTLSLSHFILSIILSICVSPLVIYLTFKVISWSALNITIVQCSFCLIMMLIPLRGVKHNSIMPIRLNAIEKKQIVILLSILLIIILTPYIEFASANDFYQCTIGDWDGREGVIWSITNNGLPLKDPFFYPGEKMLMYYPFSFYLIPAAISTISPEIHTNAIWVVIIFVVCIALYFTCLFFCDRLFGKRSVIGIFILLFCIGGFDAFAVISKSVITYFVHDQIYLVRHVDAWASASLIRVDNIYAAAIWVIPHLASVLLFLVFVELSPLTLKRPYNIILAAIISVQIFGFSPYVFIGFFIATVYKFTFMLVRDIKKSSLKYTFAYLLAGIIFMVFMIPFIIDLSHADISGGRDKLIFGVQKTNVVLFGLISPNNTFLILIDFVVFYFIELGTFFITAFICFHTLTKKRRLTYKLNFLISSCVICLILPVFMRSTGMFNDFGMRVILVSQIILAIFSCGVFIKELNINKNLYLVIIFCLFSGFLSCLWEFTFVGLARFAVRYPSDRFDLYNACEYIRYNTPVDSVVAIDPAATFKIEMARRFSSRQIMIGSKLAGSCAYTDKILLEEIEDLNRNFFLNPVDAELNSNITKNGVSYILYKKQNMKMSPMEYEIVYENNSYNVSRLKPE